MKEGWVLPGSFLMRRVRILGGNGKANNIAQGCTNGVEAVGEKRYWVVEW